MHTFLLRFLTHFRLNPLQCASNVFRIVMGTAVLMEKLGLNLTVHDITYVYSLQPTARDQYTLVARNVDRKLVTGLLDSSKGRDEDFLVITENWQNLDINCPLKPGTKEFTAKRVELVERKMVEHLLKRPCLTDSGGCPRAASVLLDYVPSYKSFQRGPTVKNFRQVEVTVSRPGRSQEEIIEAVPLTAKKGVQVPRLVTPLSNPEFVPSLESSEVDHLIIRFPSVFDPDPNPTEEMPIQKRSINISSVLRTSAPKTSGTSPLTSPPRFSQGEDVMRRKRKRREGQSDDANGQEGSSPPQAPKVKASKKGMSKHDRALQKAAGQAPQRHKHQNDPKQLWSCHFLLENRAVDERDSVLKSEKDVRGGQVAETVGKALLLPEDMKDWQEKRSKHMPKNLKRDSILLKDALTEAQAKVQKAKEDAQSYYDQGFNEAADSLQSQLKGECNKYFTQGWHKALDMAGADDASELYDLARRHQPFGVHVPEKRNKEAGEEAAEDSMVPGSHEVLNEPVLADDPEVLEDQADNHEVPEDQADDQIQTIEFREGEDGSDVEENIDVID
uniref:Uncharacterized protein n=1 Tax=Fagus sylvatica TaxID=28930 RepID=A0A2N9HIZ8_FAGSY